MLVELLKRILGSERKRCERERDYGHMTAYYELQQQGMNSWKRYNFSLALKNNQFSVLTISTFFFPKQNNLLECMGSPVSIVPARIQVLHNSKFFILGLLTSPSPETPPLCPVTK